jgi:hypothetical protein
MNEPTKRLRADKGVRRSQRNEKEIDELMADNAISETLIRNYRAEIARLRGENDKLRAALKEITQTSCDVLERLGAENANLRDDNASLRAELRRIRALQATQ